MTEVTRYDSRIRAFVDALQQLDRGARARLRRNAGRTLSNARDVHSVFFQTLPYGVDARDENMYFMAATLFATSRHEGTGKGTFGAALRVVRMARGDSERANSLDRRFQALLASESDQLAFRLRQLMRLLTSQEVAINWEQLLYDLLHWDAEGKWVQLNWARDYFVGKRQPAVANTTQSE